MTVLLNSAEIIGLPVVTVAGGEDVAEVRDVVYSPEEGRLVGLTLNKRGFLAGRHTSVLPMERVHAIGRDAVMVADASMLQRPEQASDEVGRPATERNVLGNDVLTEGGASLGTVTAIVVAAGATGEVVGYEIERDEEARGYVPLPAQLAVSGTALVVPDVTIDFIRDDLAGLAVAVDEFRARLWQR